MARKVAQSLMSPGNVKARGQRMFLRRKEKADHWTADALGPRPGLRRARAAAPAAVAEASESDAELPYYNPAPWSSAAGRSPWSHAAGPADSSPSWRPVAPRPTHGGVAPQVAFGLAKDLTRMHDKGGRMFAKLRARAAVEETEDFAPVEAARGEVMRRIADGYVPPRHDMVDDSVDHQSTPSATRLIEMIERSRVTSHGPGATQPAPGQLSRCGSGWLQGISVCPVFCCDYCALLCLAVLTQIVTDGRTDTGP